MSPDSDEICRGVAGYGLNGASRGLPSAPLNECIWTTVLEHIADQRIVGHLVQAVDDGAFAVTDAQRRAAVERYEKTLAVDLLLERLLLTTCGGLDDAGIQARVLKGAAVAHCDYPDPALRSFGDIDLLVSGSDFDSVVALLCERSARRRYPEPRKGFDSQFGKGVCVETAEGLEIDVHRSFVAGPFGLAVDADELFAARATFSLAGRVLDCLDRDARFVHACFHASLGSSEPRLVPLRDVAQILQHTDVDPDRVRRLCSHWRCGIVVQRAIRLTRETLDLSIDGELVAWAHRYEPSPFERRALDAYIGPRRSYSRQVVAGLEAIPGLRGKLAYARALLVPDEAYVRERDGGYVRRFRRSVKLLVRDWTRR